MLGAGDDSSKVHHAFRPEVMCELIQNSAGNP